MRTSTLMWFLAGALAATVALAQSADSGTPQFGAVVGVRPIWPVSDGGTPARDAGDPHSIKW